MERLKNRRVEELIEIVEAEDVESATTTSVESATTTGVEEYNVKYEKNFKKLDPSKKWYLSTGKCLMMNYFYLAYNATTTLADHASWTQMTKITLFTTFFRSRIGRNRKS